MRMFLDLDLVVHLAYAERRRLVGGLERPRRENALAAEIEGAPEPDLEDRLGDRRQDEEDDRRREEAQQREGAKDERRVGAGDKEARIDIRAGEIAKYADAKIRHDDRRRIDDNERELAGDHLVAGALVAEREREVVQRSGCDSHGEKEADRAYTHGRNPARGRMKGVRRSREGSEDAGGAEHGRRPGAGREALGIPDI